MAYKLVHYINQFFAGIGGEDKADVSPEVRDGIVGPGMAFKAAFNGEAEILATFICGDNYCANHLDDVAAHMVETVKAYGADGLIAGPAFNAGRYGTACGAVCAAVAKELQLPVVSGMYRESPGVDLYRKEVTIVETADSARGMGKAVPAMAAVMLKLLKGEAIADPEAAGVFPKGIRKNMFYEQPGAERAVQMLIKKLNGEAFRTEYPMPVFDRVEPRPAIADISKATIAIVTSGGIVPFGNPDHIAASSAQNYGAYDLDGVTDLRKGEYMTAHGLDHQLDLVLAAFRDPESSERDRPGRVFQVFFAEALRQIRRAFPNVRMRKQLRAGRQRERLPREEQNARLQLPHGIVVQMPECAVFVFLFHMLLGPEQAHVQHAVVRKQQQAFRILVQPPDRMQRLAQRLRKAGHDRLPPRVAFGGEQPARLVEHIILRHEHIPPARFSHHTGRTRKMQEHCA